MVALKSSLLTLVLLIFAQALKIARQQLPLSLSLSHSLSFARYTPFSPASEQPCGFTYRYKHIYTHIHMQLHMHVSLSPLSLCVCVCVAYLYGTYTVAWEFATFYDEREVTVFLPRFKIIVGLKEIGQLQGGER